MHVFVNIYVNICGYIDVFLCVYFFYICALIYVSYIFVFIDVCVIYINIHK